MNIPFKYFTLTLLAACLCLAPQAASAAEKKPVSFGKFYADFRLRYESVEQDNALEDADALTLRSKLGFKSNEFSGFSALIEIEDSRVLLGVDDYSVPPSGVKPGIYSVIADPETTELDQGFVQYQNGGWSAKLGRQVITLDNHRFVGHVGFRQDRQTFDALTVNYKHAKSFAAQISQLNKRNRIFAEDRDLDVNDTLVNLSYNTSFGKFTAYAYLLEEDDAAMTSIDTFGLRLNGAIKSGDSKFLYTAEFASQEANSTIDTDYALLEGGVGLAGFTAKVGYESLGSDQGLGAFATPLATLHKFNGWTDQFLATPTHGLDDLYLSVSGNFAGGAWTAVYHDFTANVANAGNRDLGDELNLVFTRKFGDHYSIGVKYGNYTAGDDVFSKVDTTKTWAWLGVQF